MWVCIQVGGFLLVESRCVYSFVLLVIFGDFCFGPCDHPKLVNLRLQQSQLLMIYSVMFCSDDQSAIFVCIWSDETMHKSKNSVFVQIADRTNCIHRAHGQMSGPHRSSNHLSLDVPLFHSHGLGSPFYVNTQLERYCAFSNRMARRFFSHPTFFLS